MRNSGNKIHSDIKYIMVETSPSLKSDQIEALAIVKLWSDKRHENTKIFRKYFKLVLMSVLK